MVYTVCERDRGEQTDNSITVVYCCDSLSKWNTNT